MEDIRERLKKFKCTAAPGFVDNDTVPIRGEMVMGARLFAFQQFIPGDTLDPTYNSKAPYTEEQISQPADIMTSYFDEITLRV